MVTLDEKMRELAFDEWLEGFDEGFKEGFKESFVEKYIDSFLKYLRKPIEGFSSGARTGIVSDMSDDESSGSDTIPEQNIHLSESDEILDRETEGIEKNNQIPLSLPRRKIMGQKQKPYPYGEHLEAFVKGFEDGFETCFFDSFKKGRDDDRETIVFGMIKDGRTESEIVSILNMIPSETITSLAAKWKYVKTVS